MGIARCLTFGGAKGRVLHDPAIPPRQQLTREQYMDKSAEQTTLNHFYEKLLLLKVGSAVLASYLPVSCSSLEGGGMSFVVRKHVCCACFAPTGARLFPFHTSATQLGLEQFNLSQHESCASCARRRRVSAWWHSVCSCHSVSRGHPARCSLPGCAPGVPTWLAGWLLGWLQDLMKTEAGRRVAEGRHRYMEGFLSQLLPEWEGEA